MHLDRDPIKWVWSGIALCGVAIALNNWCDATHDLEAIRHFPNFREGGPRDIIASGHQRREAIRLVGHSANLLVGITSIVLKPSRLQRSVAIVMLLTNEACLLANGWLDRRTRHTVMRLPASSIRRAMDRRES